MRIGIVGCGWLGLPLAQRLGSLGHTVIGSTSREERLPILKAQGIQPVLIHLSEKEISGNPEALQSIEVLVLTVPPGGRRNPRAAALYPQKIGLLLELLPACHIVYTSSTSVYGTPKGLVGLSQPPMPTTASGHAILAVEELLTRHSPSVTILRLAGLIGPDRHPATFLAGRQNLPDGDAPVNLIYRDDVIQAIEAVIQQQRWGVILPLAAPLHPAKKVYYPHIARQLGLIPPQFDAGGADAKCIDASDTLAMLGITLAYPDPYEMPLSSI